MHSVPFNLHSSQGLNSFISLNLNSLHVPHIQSLESLLLSNERIPFHYNLQPSFVGTGFPFQPNFVIQNPFYNQISEGFSFIPVQENFLNAYPQFLLHDNQSINKKNISEKFDLILCNNIKENSIIKKKFPNINNEKINVEPARIVQNEILLPDPQNNLSPKNLENFKKNSESIKNERNLKEDFNNFKLSNLDEMKCEQGNINPKILEKKETTHRLKYKNLKSKEHRNIRNKKKKCNIQLKGYKQEFESSSQINLNELKEMQNQVSNNEIRHGELLNKQHFKQIKKTNYMKRYRVKGSFVTKDQALELLKFPIKNFVNNKELLNLKKKHPKYSITAKIDGVCFNHFDDLIFEGTNILSLNNEIDNTKFQIDFKKIDYTKKCIYIEISSLYVNDNNSNINQFDKNISAKDPFNIKSTVLFDINKKIVQHEILKRELTEKKYGDINDRFN